MNAPPAGATLILLGTSATLDRAADSGSRVRIALAGSPPTLASVPVSTGPDGRPAPPQTQAVASALAALPPRSPLVLVGAAPDGAQRSVVLALGDTPPASSAPDSNGIVTVVFEGDVVDSPADVALSRGAAAGYVSAPGRVSRAALPARRGVCGRAVVMVEGGGAEGRVRRKRVEGRVARKTPPPPRRPPPCLPRAARSNLACSAGPPAPATPRPA